ncbi:pyridoxal kinase [Thermodesulfomicrobium sp. WS]|uniref:pyridoxamine kinase n=1 Tax=Thermodesulfomicrobium sp. WS TaxID=3004129 RepID=UPI002492694E|nr:pyridoxamine kinase [Thermodesulfomicrobium sp. WS]BDV01222.1 pyridoxal kinase [Thermodesulfomicrobium sp. WS]
MKPPVPTAVRRIAAIHDLSGFGGGSLAAAIPILSSLGFQVCALPTALLSTHTGGFTGFHFRDLTEDMAAILAHWQRLELRFAAIYSGFLGSPEQIRIVQEACATVGKDALIVVDPVLGDNGALYPTMDEAMVAGMRKLAAHAHVITPNVTEAALLLGEPLDMVSALPTQVIKDWARRLAVTGPCWVVLTGLPAAAPDRTQTVAYDRRTDKFWRVECDYVPASYPGTGDMFASVLTGALLQGDSLPIALDRAVHFVALAIRATFGHGAPEREGVLLERVLPSLAAPVSISSYQLL